MPRQACCRFEPVYNRRELLRTSAAGFGLLALQGLLGQQTAQAGNAAEPTGTNPLSPRAPHFAPRAKRVIFLFMHGGPSQVDTFDYKPLLARDHGKPLPFDKPRVVSSDTGNLLASPWKFAQHGDSAPGSASCFRTWPTASTTCAFCTGCTVPTLVMAAPVGAAHRQRYVRAPQHGIVDWLRAGN